MGEHHLGAPGPPPTSALRSPYLGTKAQLVDGVLGLGVLGEELVVVLLREREADTSRAHALAGRAPHPGSQAAHAPRRGQGPSGRGGRTAC